MKLTDIENYADIRRLYRYIWMLYGLLLTVFGAQQILRFIFYISGEVLGPMGREVAVNGIALLVVGTPIWVYSWRTIQESLADGREMTSTLRLGILYLLALGGVITVITTSWMVLNTVLNALLGESTSLNVFLREIGGPISIGVPLGIVWAYFGHWLNRHIDAIADPVRQSSLRRLYHYTLAFIGLVVAFVGVGTLFSFLIDQLTLGLTVSGRVRERLVSSISSLIVGLPLWLINWRPMQAEALSPGEVGDHARRSVLRKTYLYLALFASVIGGMATAVGLVYNVLRVVLTGDSGNDFVNNILNLTQLLFLFGVVLMYHLNVLRTDGAATADSLADKQNEYSVLVVDSGDGFVESLRAALARFAPKVPVTVAPPLARPEGNFNALVLRGSLAVDAPEWIRSFDGDRVVVQDDALDIFWSADSVQAAQFVQKLAEGEQVQKQKPGRSPWTVAVYVFAALFAIQLLFILMALGISLIG